MGSVEEIPLVLDLGPEPSLTDTLTRSKPWFRGEKPEKSTGAPDPTSLAQRTVFALPQWLTPWQRHLWFLGLAGVGAVLLLALAGYALARWFTREQGALKTSASQSRRAFSDRFEAGSLRPFRRGGNKGSRARSPTRICDHGHRPRWRGDASSGSVPGHGNGRRGQRLGRSAQSRAIDRACQCPFRLLGGQWLAKAQRRSGSQPGSDCRDQRSTAFLDRRLRNESGSRRSDHRRAVRGPISR